MTRRATRKPKLTKSEQMARVRNRDTGLEILLRESLWRAGLRYRLRPRLPGTPDLGFAAARVAVFVDGCFWHGCPAHGTQPKRNGEWWSAKLNRNVERDRETDEHLAMLGWEVIRVWEHESPAAAAQRIEARVRAPRLSASVIRAVPDDQGGMLARIS